MRIGVHLEALRPGEIGGLEDYVRHLLPEVLRLDGEVTFVLLLADYNFASFEGAEGCERHLLEAAELAALDARRLDDFRLDLWFCPLLVLEPARPGLPAVATVPDLQHEVYPEFFSPEVLDWRRLRYRRTVERAERVLTFSRYSKAQLVERLGADPERVVVTYLDGAPELAAADADTPTPGAVRARYGLPERYFFYPGASWPHKNHRVLFEALAELKRRHPSAPSLVLTGARIDGGVDLRAACRRLGLEDDVHLLGYVPRDDLPALYSASLATVFPSLFEGFGIPVVEAMRAGSPVICSSATSLPEIAGDAAVYFDPARADELCARLAAFHAAGSNGVPVTSASEPVRSRRDLVRAGRLQAAKFSWERTARATLDAFRAALAGRHAALAPPAVAPPAVAPPAVAPPADVTSLPLITVVTPSLDQAGYVGRTVRSVLDQGYPRLEHLVIDGASRDGTVELLRGFKAEAPRRFDYVSERDRGQAHAVNKGFERARGEIVGWLNSDDTYEPGALEAVARFFAEHPGCDMLYGRAHYVDEDDQLLGVYPTRPEFHWQTLAHECFICQPTVFLRRRVLDELGFRLDERLQMCMDYDLWIRLGRRLEVRFLDRVLARSRMYRDNKTISRRSEVYREIFHTVRRHYGRLPFSWALGRAHHVWDHGDPFFNVRRLTWVTYLIAGFFLVRYNGSRPRTWPSLCREVWVPLSAKMKKRWRALQARDSAT